MQSSELTLINEYFEERRVSPAEIDLLLSEGWRHFGSYFYRYSLGIYQGAIRKVLPLRINLKDFEFSKSQRKNLKRNADLESIIRPINIDDEKIGLFERHKYRFEDNIPESIFTFLDHDAANTPCEAMEVCIYESGKLLAASFIDIGMNSISSIYGIFEPAESKRGLGIFTMLKEIEFAKANGKSFYYHGYAYEGNSFYDYKKRFGSLETFDWKGNWIEYSEGG